MIYDIIIGIILIIGLITGYKRGLVLKVFDFVKLLLALYLTPKCTGFVKSMYIKLNINVEYNFLIYLTTFIIIMLIISLLTYVINKFVSQSNLGFINSILGSLVSFVEVYIISFVIMITSLFAIPYYNGIAKELQKSMVMYSLSLSSSELNKYFPEKVKEKLDDFYFQNKKTKLKKEIMKKINSVGE